MPFDTTTTALALACLGALCLGISKAGFPGLAIVNVLVIAELFGAKNSVGIILPMLLILKRGGGCRHAPARCLHESVSCAGCRASGLCRRLQAEAFLLARPPVNLKNAGPIFKL